MSPTIRNLLVSFLIAAVAPMGLAALDLEQSAYAKNGNGNGGGKGGGSGGGAGDHGAKGGSANAKGHAKASKIDSGEDGESMHPSELGKLNGVLHASPNAIDNASVNSPIGTARAFGEALAGFLGLSDEDEGEETTEGEETSEETEGEETEETETATVEELGGMMANMTNKPVTADQVQAVAEKVGISTTDAAPTDETPGDETAGDEAAGDETTGEQTTEGEETGATASLDQATAQEIADEANRIHGYDTGEDTEGDDTGGDETADAGDPDETGDAGDESLTN